MPIEILFFLDSSIKKPPPKDIPNVNPINIIFATFSDIPKYDKGTFKIFIIICQKPINFKILIVGNSLVKKFV